MKAILLQYFKKNNSVIGLQIINDQGNIALFQSNEFFTEDIIFNSIRVSKDKLDVLYYLVTDKYLKDSPYKKILFEFESEKRGVSLSHSKIRNNFKINVHPTSEISSYVNILAEKILHQFCKPETDLTERIKLVDLLTNTYNFYSEIYTNEKINPEIKKYIDQIKNFEFNNEKIEALSVFLDFINVKSHAIYILRGSAGTGKTTLVRYFLDLFNHIHKATNYKLLAPTGKAARVLEQKTKLSCNTIHKTIYSYKITTEKKSKANASSDTTVKSKEVQLNLFSDYELSHNEDYEIIQNQYLLDSGESIAFMVIDESSMVTDYRSEFELEMEHEKMMKSGRRFYNCTGYHLNDVIKFVEQSNKYVKLILVGDAYQLPPIDSGHEKFIPALDQNFIKEKYPKFKIFSYQLNQTFRFANEEIYMLSLFLRNKIENAFSKGILKSYFKYDFNILINEFLIDHPYINIYKYRNLHEMLVDVKNDIQSGVNNIILTWRNEVSNYINNETRYLLGRKYPVEPDDKFVCTKNNYDNSIMNGEQFKIVKLNEVLFREVINLQLGISQIIPFFNVTIKFDYSEKNELNQLLALDISEVYSPTNIKWYNPKYSFDNKYKNINYLLDKEFKSRIKYRFFMQVKEQLKEYINNGSLHNQVISKELCKKLIKKFNISNQNDIDVKIKIDNLISETKDDFRSYVVKYISNDKFLNSLISKYGYSITCHKSQGSEWSHVYVTDVNFNDLCWLYTAITRASQRVSFLGGKIDIAQSNPHIKSHFRLLRFFEGEILNVMNLIILGVNEFTEYLNSFYLPSTSMVLRQNTLQSLDKMDKIIIVETINENYYFPPDMIDDSEIEIFNKLKINNSNIKLSFMKDKNHKFSKVKVISE